MKNIFTLCALVASLNVFAQQQKGDLSVQFSGNYFKQRVTLDDLKYKFGAGNIYVKVGKFFTTNLEMGVKPNVNMVLFTEEETTKSGEIVKTKSKLRTNIGFGIYGTYSFLTNDGKFLPYGGAEISYVPIGDEKTINLGPYAGVKYFVSERINVDANLSWLTNLGSTYEEPKGFYNIGPLFNCNIGVGVLIGKVND
jgi:hypothetical protein